MRSALDRMNKDENFVFVFSQAHIYRFIEKFDPEMFLEIQRRVKEGRFVLVGGWTVQPDCNIPSGESFCRQGMYSQRYFIKKFGRMARTGYCVDSFGHNANLPQILYKSGLVNYVFMRPFEYEQSLGSDVFNWKSKDGSSVLAFRICETYHSEFVDAKDLEKVIKKNREYYDDDTGELREILITEL